MVVNVINGLVRKNFLLIAIAILGLIAVKTFVISPLIWTDYQLQGLTWEYGSPAGQLTPQTYNENTISLSATCSNAGCQPYREDEMSLTFQNKFDISKYTEISMFSRTTVTAGIGGNSMSASGTFTIDVGGINAYGITANAEERGGTYIGGQTKTENMLTTLKKEGNGWGIYQNNIKTQVINEINPKIKIRVGATATQDKASASANSQITIQLKAAAASIIPINAAPPVLSSFLAAIKDWISKILNAIPFLTIAGSQSPNLGTIQTYTVNLAAPYPIDLQYADGTYSTRYCNVALVKSDGTIIAEKGWETCADTYSPTFTVGIPKTPAQYVVIAIMTENKALFNANTQQWDYVGYEIIGKDALDVTTKVPLPNVNSIPPPSSANIFRNIWSWLIGLFKF